MKKISSKYAAGFFDGEGSITVTIYKPTTSNILIPHVRAAASNYIQAPIEALSATWGGSCSHNKADVYTVNFNGIAAVRFLIDVYPYLLVKKEGAYHAIQMHRESQDPVRRLEEAIAVMDATRKGYRAIRPDKTYNALKTCLAELKQELGL